MPFSAVVEKLVGSMMAAVRGARIFSAVVERLVGSMMAVRGVLVCNVPRLARTGRNCASFLNSWNFLFRHWHTVVPFGVFLAAFDACFHPPTCCVGLTYCD